MQLRLVNTHMSVFHLFQGSREKFLQQLGENRKERSEGYIKLFGQNILSNFEKTYT